MSKARLEFTQISFASEVKDWINEIIKNEKLRFEYADIEMKDPRRKRADVIVWGKRVEKPALLIEIWDASTPPWEYALDSALAKAWKNNIPYFVVWNLTHFYCWDTFGEGEVIDKLWWPHAGVSETVTEALTYEDAILRYREGIKNYLKIFLKEFEGVYYGIRAKPLLGIDERFIYRLRGTIHALSIPVFEELKRRTQEDIQFRRDLIKYFREQAWTFKGTDEDFEKVARQYIYLLTNKILFYNILRSIPLYRDLPKIVIPMVGITGKELRDKLNSYFIRGFEATGNYETILLTDFLDSIIPPDSVVGGLKDFIHKIGEYDFSRITYEILGNIFQRLIPEEERHKLGQYFTRSDVVDLIVGFCVRNADDKALDGGCGAGTFLVRSYIRKKMLNPNKKHRELIKEIFGIDIAKFPAHLSTINLASRDLSGVENHPNILHKDFFDVEPGGEYVVAEHRVEGLGERKLPVKVPESFEAVAMNPPYTRQEEMEDILEEEKSKAHNTCIEDWINLNPDKYRKSNPPKLSKRSSIYVHFFIHGARFLKEGGRLGLITSNSWLDVDYGKDLQRFFLENFKIIAIIESKVERWFEDADINTAITILERCSNHEERSNNLVRFVQLKKPLTEFIPPTKDENERWSFVEKFVKTIEESDRYLENENFRIFPKKQKELWEEGYDEEKGEYVGSKWGKYIRAPEIFYKILNKAPEKIKKLSDIIRDIRYGLKTGAEDFFYLDYKKIERFNIKYEFTRPIITSPRESVNIIIVPENLKTRLLYIDEKDVASNRGLQEYIKLGEQRGIDKRPSLKGRKYWYSLKNWFPWNVAIPRLFNDRYIVFFNPKRVIVDDSFTELNVDQNPETMILILNSTLSYFFLEISGSVGLGQGALFLSSQDIKSLLSLDLTKVPEEILSKLKTFSKIFSRPVGTIFEEIGTNSLEEVSLDKVKPDRRELDKIIMGEILGLTEEEQLEVYRAVVDVVKSRLERAKSVQKRKKVGELNVDELVNSVLKDVEEIHGIKAKAFPEDYIGECECKIVEVPKGSRVGAGYDIEGPYVQVDNERIRCSSIYEARFIEYAVLAGKTRITIPKDENMLRKAVEERGRLLKDAREKVEEFINEAIADRKLREKVRLEAFRRLGI